MVFRTRIADNNNQKKYTIQMCVTALYSHRTIGMKGFTFDAKVAAKCRNQKHLGNIVCNDCAHLESNGPSDGNTRTQSHSTQIKSIFKRSGKMVVLVNVDVSVSGTIEREQKKRKLLHFYPVDSISCVFQPFGPPFFAPFRTILIIRQKCRGEI